MSEQVRAFPPLPDGKVAVKQLDYFQFECKAEELTAQLAEAGLGGWDLLAVQTTHAENWGGGNHYRLFFSRLLSLAGDQPAPAGEVAEAGGSAGGTGGTGDGGGQRAAAKPTAPAPKAAPSAPKTVAVAGSKTATVVRR